MKKLVFLVVLFSTFFACRDKQTNIERHLENGVEVVVNHLTPYKIKGEASNLKLEQVVTIDVENEDIAGLGLSVIWDFDIDSEGNIYILDISSKENWIYKFGSDGKFLTSFVRAGQGPGEFNTAFVLRINSHDEIVAADSGKQKYIVFTKDGKLISEIPKPPHFADATPLNNGKYLTWWQLAYSYMDEYFLSRLIICDQEFKETREIYSRKMPNYSIAERIRGTNYIFDCRASAKNVYLVDEERGYEIAVFDLDGNLVRKIRKECRPVKVTEEFKKQRLAEIKKKIYFPAYMPPLHSFMPDDEGRLLVMTYEQGENPGEYIYDIFNPDGVFVGRKSLRLSWQTGSFLSKIKKDRLYGIWEKENGYKELVVYRMRWE